MFINSISTASTNINNVTSSTPTLTLNPPFIVNMDSGCNGIFVPPMSTTHLDNVAPNESTLHISNPDGSLMHSENHGYIPIPTIDKQCRKALIVNELTSPLLGISTICADNIKVIFDDKEVIAIKKDTNECVLQGNLDKEKGLYMVDINNQHHQNQYQNSVTDPFPVTHMSNLSSVATSASVVPLKNRFEALTDDDETDSESDDDLPNEPISPTWVANESLYVKRTTAQFVNHYHKVLFSPTLSQMKKAVSAGRLSMFPQLTMDILNKHPPNSIHTAKGHLDRIKQGIRSTKLKDFTLHKEDMNYEPDNGDYIPLQTSSEIQNGVFVKTFHPHTIYSDATGDFPIKAKSGNQSILIVFFEATNEIKSFPLPNKTSAAYIDTYKTIIGYCKTHSVVPNLLMLDNQTSNDIENYFNSIKLQFQYVPPKNHRANKAERAIRTWKNHFIAGLSSVSPDFDFTLWDHLLPQCDLTLNLLRESAMDKSKSAWEQVHGSYDFAAHPIHQPGCKVLSWVSPDSRSSFAAHGDEGYYLGPSFKHYRSFKIYIPGTNAYRITDTISWHPFNPLLGDEFSSQDVLIDAISHLGSALTNYVEVDNMKHKSSTNSHLVVRKSIKSLKDIIGPLAHVVTGADTYTNFPDNVLPTSETEHVFQSSEGAPVPSSEGAHSVPSSEGVQLQPKRSARTAAKPSRYASATILTANAIRIAKEINEAIQDPPDFSEEPWSQNMYDLVDNHLRLYEKSHMVQATPNYTVNAASYHPTTGEKLTTATTRNGQHAKEWVQATCDEFDRLFVTYDTMKLLHYLDIPQGAHFSYLSLAYRCKIVNGVEERRVRGAYGGDRSDYTGERAAHTADLTTVKILCNEIVSDNEAEAATLDIKDFYLHTRLEKKEYMMIGLKQIPDTIITKYNVMQYVRPGTDKVAVEVNGGIYGLPQAGYLAMKKLYTSLEQDGYTPTQPNSCLFKHCSNSVIFTLVVDDFLVKHRDQDIDHLITTLQKHYPIKINKNTSKLKYLGYDIEDTGKGTPQRELTLAMPKSIPSALTKFGIIPTHNVFSPEKYVAATYGSINAQLTKVVDSPLVSEADKKRISEIVGFMLYYSRALDGTMPGTVTRLASEQAHATEDTLAATEYLLRYAATYPTVQLVFRPSDMILRMDSDASYNSLPGAKSMHSHCAWLGKKDDPEWRNGFIDVTAKIIPTVVASASEAEYAGLFMTGRGGRPLRQVLNDIGHIQPPTTITTDNTTAQGIAKDTCKSRRSKAIDMRYHWIRDRVNDKEFNIIWQPGNESSADLNTKKQPAAQMLKMRHRFVRDSGPAFTNSKVRRDTKHKSLTNIS